MFNELKIVLILSLLFNVHCFTELIIILGNNSPNIQNERIKTAIQYIKETNNKKIIYLSGGIKKYYLNKLRLPSESSLMYDQLNSKLNNFKDFDIIMDEKSTNSAENFVYLKKWVFKNYPLYDFNYTIITSDFHKNRAEKLFNGIFPNIQSKFVLSNSNCYSCWNDELLHLRNVNSDIMNANILLN